jgi:hypothetical protein
MADYPSGLRFPMAINPAGGWGIVVGSDKIASNLKALVLSHIKERVIYKNVGTVGYDAVFRAVPSPLIVALVKEAISKYEPRAVNVSVLVRREELDSGTAVFCDVRYAFKFSEKPSMITVELK